MLGSPKSRRSAARSPTPPSAGSACLAGWASGRQPALPRLRLIPCKGSHSHLSARSGLPVWQGNRLAHHIASGLPRRPSHRGRYGAAPTMRANPPSHGPINWHGSNAGNVPLVRTYGPIRRQACRQISTWAREPSSRQIVFGPNRDPSCRLTHRRHRSASVLTLLSSLACRTPVRPPQQILHRSRLSRSASGRLISTSTGFCKYWKRDSRQRCATSFLFRMSESRNFQVLCFIMADSITAFSNAFIKS